MEWDDMDKCKKCNAIQGSIIISNDKPFGTTHLMGTINGCPFVTLSYSGGATLLYFEGKWKKIRYNSLAELHDAIDIGNWNNV